MEAVFDVFYTLCCKKIQISTKIRVFPFGTLSETPDLEKISPLHIDGRSVLST